MSLKTSNIIKGILAFLATLLVLYGMVFLWQNYIIIKPLNDELMEINGINQVVIDKPIKINNPFNITISLDRVSDFSQTYTKINHVVNETFKSTAYEINIYGNESDELENLYSQILLYAEKSLIDGSFPSLVEKGNDLAEVIGADANISVDDKYIYIYIAKEDKTLYKLVSR